MMALGSCLCLRQLLYLSSGVASEPRVEKKGLAGVIPA